MATNLLGEVAARRRLPEPAVRKLLRERSMLTQAEIADAIGVSRQAVSRWESGKRYPRREHLGRYMAILDQLVVIP
jgi:transcriptional regulator with XRE-family HTH domain